MTTATKYKTYPKYKPSGIDWLDDIPDEWEVKNVMYQYRLKNGYAFKTEDFVDDGVPIVKMSNLKDGRLDFESSSKIPESICLKDFEIQSGDLLIGLSGSIENFATAKESDLPCQLNQRVGKFLIIDGNSKKFLQYFLESKVYREQVFILSNGSTIMNVSTEQIEHLKMFVPPIEDQKSIADFLDRETAKIDEMVAKKEKMIDLLKEKRQALITHAVTKGLDPKAKLKSSGIDWLGDIPEGWEVKRLRFVIKTNPSKQETKVNSPEIEVSFIPMEAVSEEGEIDLSTTKMIEDVIDGYTYFRDGDVVIAKITPCFENGKGAIMHNLTNGVGFGTTEFHVLRSSNIDSKYLYLITRIYPFRAFGEVNMKGAAGQKRVPEDFIKDFSLGVPRIDEQKKIVAFLDRETAKIDGMMKKVEMQIEKLQEYRQALITSAVTGKIMVN